MTQSDTTAVITMAGAGRRFREAGYDVPKFAVEVGGRSLLNWSLQSLLSFADSITEWVFVARAEDHARPFIQQQATALAISTPHILELSQITDGQATSALLAGELITDRTRPVLIYNVDTYVESRCLPGSAVRGDGWIPCFPGSGSAWSFAKADPDGRVREVREKQRISPHATIGLYWFSSFSLYSQAYDRYYAAGDTLERGERYIAPLYNQLIRDGRTVYLHEIPLSCVHPLGTPTEVEAFRSAHNQPLMG